MNPAGWRRAIPDVALPLLALLLALMTVTVLLMLTGANPIAAYQSVSDAAFGSPFAASVTIVKTFPRLLTALGIAIALRAGLWNIGGEGQIYLGAVGATAVALFLPGLAAPVSLLLAVAAGAAAGGLWALIPGALRAYRGVSEVITTLMLVYIGIQLANYLVEGPWIVAHSTYPSTRPFSANYALPILLEGTLLNAGLIVAIAMVVVAMLIVTRSTFGLQLRAVGGGVRAARFAGIKVQRVIVLAMTCSGAFAGIAGAIEVLGVRGRLVEGFSPGYGFEAIAIALIGRMQPVAIVGVAFFFAILDAGSSGLQTSGHGIPASIVQVTEAITVIYVLIALSANELFARRRQARAALAGAHMPKAPTSASGTSRTDGDQ
jgi:simple sugar transport system permease protein